MKGIEPQTRTMAKHAARKSGMTLGEWLNSVISEQSDTMVEDRETVGPMTTSASSQSIDSFERATTRLEDIAQQLARIARQETDAASTYSYGHAAPARGDTDSLNRIINRVEANERQTVEAFSAVNERLSVLGRQFAQATKSNSARSEDSTAYQTMEKAVRNIIEHMEASEKRNRDNFRSLQDRFADLSGKVASASSDHVLRQAPAFSQLELRLNELARRVDSTESSVSRGLPDLVRQELDELVGRIDTVRDTAEHLASRAQTQAVQASQEELRTIEQRILGLLNDAQRTFQGGANPVDIQQLRADIEHTNSRIDDARRGVASEHDVKALRQTVEHLSGKVQQTADSRPLVEMDQRIVELAQRMQTMQSAPLSTELEHRFADLEARVHEAVRVPADTQVQDALQHQMAQFAERMDRTERQVSHFETIERAITQLYEGLEQTRNSAKQVAEDAASRVAAQFAQQQPLAQSISLTGAPEIVALEHGLQALRESTNGADQRNQETLVAVHDTLEHIVSKLAELETAAIGQRLAAAAVAAPVSSVHEAQNEDVRSSYVGPGSTHSEPEAFSNNSPDHELHTSVQSPYLNVGQDSFTLSVPQMQDDPVLSADVAPQVDDAFTADVETKSGGTDDFIAAARRAAQAAQQQKSVLAGLSPTAATLSEKSSRKLLNKVQGALPNLPFLKKFAKGKAKKPDLQTLVNAPEGHAGNQASHCHC